MYPCDVYKVNELSNKFLIADDDYLRDDTLEEVRKIKNHSCNDHVFNATS